MNELDTQQQLFVIMMEECGELIQQCSKCLRSSDYNFAYLMTDENKEQLMREVGDVYAMIELMVKHKLMSWTDVYNNAEKKKKKLKQWSDLII